MYYWNKEPNRTVIECDKCGKVLKFEDKYFKSHSRDSCETNTVLQCSCGNTANGIIRTKNKGQISQYDRTKSNEVHCPHCGSTNIQLMRKKWSLLTGFLTNKVERYCVNCGKKF